MDKKSQTKNPEEHGSSKQNLEYPKLQLSNIEEEMRLKIEALEKDLIESRIECDGLKKEQIDSQEKAALAIEQLNILQDELEQMFEADQAKKRKIQLLERKECEMLVALKNKHDELRLMDKCLKQAREEFHLSLLQLVEQIHREQDLHNFHKRKQSELLEENDRLIGRAANLILNSTELMLHTSIQEQPS